MTEAEEILLVAGGQPAFPLVSTLPADGNPPVVWFDGGVWEWNGSDWVQMDNYLVTDDGYVLNDTGGKICVDTTGSIALDDNRFVLTDDNGNIFEV